MLAERGAIGLAITPRRVRRVLCWIVGTLTVLSLLAQIARFPLDSPSVKGLVPFFDSDEETNLPTYYSSAALGLASLLAFARAAVARREGDRYARHWALMSGLFLIASCDEFVQLHEKTNDALVDVFDLGKEALPWIVPGAILVLCLAIFYRRFFTELPPPVRRLIVLGGAVFVGGALGLEVLEGVAASFDGEGGEFADGLISTLQELAEMLGVVFVIEAILTDLALRQPPPRLEFRG